MPASKESNKVTTPDVLEIPGVPGVHSTLPGFQPVLEHLDRLCSSGILASCLNQGNTVFTI